DDDCAKQVANVLAQDPVNYDAVFTDGALRLAKGDAAGAIRDFEYLCNVYRQNAEVRHRAALAYLQSTKGASEVNARNAVDAAESRLNEAIRIDPRFEPAVLLFAELKIRKGTAAAAIEPLTALIQAKPQIPQAHYLLASAYIAQQNAGQALAVYRRMQELFPQ